MSLLNDEATLETLRVIRNRAMFVFTVERMPNH